MPPEHLCRLTILTECDKKEPITAEEAMTRLPEKGLAGAGYNGNTGDNAHQGLKKLRRVLLAILSYGYIDENDSTIFALAPMSNRFSFSGCAQSGHAEFMHFATNASST